MESDREKELQAEIERLRSELFRAMAEHGSAPKGGEEPSGEIPPAAAPEPKGAEALLEPFIRGYSAVYLVDLRTDRFTRIKEKRPVRERYGGEGGFHAAMERYIAEGVAEADQERMRRETDYGRIRERGKAAGPRRVEYRGKTGLLHEMALALTEDGEGLVAAFAERNLEILERHLLEKARTDCFGMYAINLDEEVLTVLKASPWYGAGTTGSVLAYRETVRPFVEALPGEAREYFGRFIDPEALRGLFEKEDKRTYSYWSETVDGGKWVTATSYVLLRNADGRAAVVTLGFSLLDAQGRGERELREQQDKHLAIIRGLASEYTALYHVDLVTGEYINYQTTDRIRDTREASERCRNFDELMKDFLGRGAVHPEEREALEAFCGTGEQMKRTLEGRKRSSMIFRRKYGGGEYLWTELTLVKCEAAAEEARTVVAGVRNVDAEVRQQLKQEEELKAALGMAQSANRAKTTFLNNMSHDIRTPMNAIIGYTDLAARHIGNTEQVRGYLTKIGQASNHLLSLINDVLDMSRIESGKMNLDEHGESLPAILHTLGDIVQADVNAKQLDFQMDAVDVTDEAVVCDKLRLNQVLLNVLSNAIKYTPAGGTVKLRLKEQTSARRGYGRYEFRIRDNGMGMTEEFLKTIYDPFTRVKSSTVSGIQGTGLGMVITKNIIDMMGGEISIASEPGKGTEVTMTFDFKLQGAERGAPRIPELEGGRALVVDDDENTCLSISGMLKAMGMRGEWCTTGKEAVERAEVAFRQGDAYRLHILDWLMPDLNGIETARRIRKVSGAEAPIFLLAAHDWSDVEEEARGAGVTAFVSKPMFPSDLRQALDRCLGKEKAPEAEKGLEADFAGKSVLLVEDNELNREIAGELLTGFGFSVTMAEDGSVAVERMKAAKAGDYDLVLMDVQMPILNGYEATRQIRALGTEISKIPIVAMTADAFEEDRRMAFDAGMNEHITKPIKVSTLRSTLARFLGKET